MLTECECFAIDALSENGISLTVRAENPAAAANIDLEISGEPWELKNVTNVSSSVGNQLRRIRRKWWKLKLAKPVRAVITTKNAVDTTEDIIESLIKKKHDDELFWVISDNREIVVVQQNGTVSRRRSPGVSRLHQ